MVKGIGKSLILAQTQMAEDVSQDLVTEFTFEKIIYALIALFFAYGAVFLIQKITNWIAERVPRRYRLLTKQSLPFWKGLILIITIAYLVRLFFNLSESNLLALTGSIAVAVGFAFKDYISSIIAGVVALFESPYRVGDRIQIGDHYGEVVSYGLRGIQIQTPDDNTVTIPHNKAWTEAISNSNGGNLEAQVATEFFFEHDADDETIINILYQAAYCSKYTQLKLPIRVLMKEEEWGTKFKLRCYPMDARDEFPYQTDLIRRAKKAFARHNIAYLKRFSDFE
ncbi:mechanosensitive ion channel family protein [Cyanobacterium stanieri LEGE 03274]|uniref:Mechanosensitive ion channel family protein n=1 Tax=Cyanobacterium stanieri LEGE 03274 TaxID=1828756 RepID=A0ABR9V6U8_9CHRO|nr:mechanosensitive ion channel family protein [Cyanobacterium stanieri]MBE9223603.1 mechanosensitive ion channel family protein [Cyanobacterium stanieri LEGE 03274]